MPGILAYWYFHIPNFVLAALVYTLLGRFVLGFFVPENWDNYIWRAFKRLTDPVVALAALAAPAIVHHRVSLLFSMLWLTAARAAYALILANAGLLPPAVAA
jgi:uncharacterized protein YggT (Ycf19 family)